MDATDPSLMMQGFCYLYLLLSRVPLTHVLLSHVVRAALNLSVQLYAELPCVFQPAGSYNVKATQLVNWLDIWSFAQ